PLELQLAQERVEVRVAARPAVGDDHEGAVAAARGAERQVQVEGGDVRSLAPRRPHPRPPGSPIRRTAREAPLRTPTPPTRLLRRLDASALLHALLPLPLALEELALARDVAAVALGQHVLALGAHGLAGDHLAADHRLDRHLEELARDGALQALDERLAPRV